MNIFEQKKKGWKIAACALVFLLSLPAAGYSQNKSIKALIQDLGNPRDNWKLREKALKSLTKKGSSAVDPLIAALKNDKNYLVRRSAAEGLGKMKAKKAIKSLITAMGERDEYVRGSAATALVDIKGPAVDPLIGALKSSSWMIRLNAAWALGEIGKKKAREPLKKLAKNDPDARVLQIAQKALSKIR